MNYGNLMRPVFLLFLGLFAPLSGTMDNYFGPRRTVIISSIVVEIVFFFLYFQRNLWLFYLLTLLLGMGNGLSMQVLIKNSCQYYPNKKGLISSLINSIGTLFGSLYTFLGEFIINPERKSVINSQKAPYYSEEISEKSRNFFLFAMILIPITIIISVLLLYRYDPSCDKNIYIEKLNVNGSLNIEGEERTFNTSNSISKPFRKSDIKLVLGNFRFWRTLLIIGVMPFIIGFISATSRPYSVMLGVNGKVIGYLVGTINILGCITSPIWAFCVDKFGFRPIMLIISCITIALSIYFFIFMNSPSFYVFGLYISSSLRGGIISSLIPHMMEVYGLKYFLILGGIGRTFIQLFSFGAAGTSIIISIFRKGKDQLLLPYRIVSFISIFFAVFGLILTFYENDKKFKYEVNENETNNIFMELGESKEDNLNKSF